MSELWAHWTFYIHLQNTNDWTYESYYKIYKCESLQSVVAIHKSLGGELLKKSLVFLMKDNIQPLWEEPNNRNGGSFSFKIHNKDIEHVWKQILYHMIGGELVKDKEILSHLNGISVSPKKTFCILKIWMDNCDYTNTNIFKQIQGVDYKGCLFKKHAY
ncbi:putative eukaryotic initiation factor 4E family [Organic Lake phycodnavirus 1]|jgi:hypothetical protein|nr:putative eukaryotic initiation factor 4E family [Organic Lake phycodnavirus 1]